MSTDIKEIKAKHKAILSLIKAYTLHAYGWEPEKEGDWQYVSDKILLILIGK